MDAGDLELVRRMIRDAGIDADVMNERDRTLRESIMMETRQYVDARIDERTMSALAEATISPVVLPPVEPEPEPESPADAITETVDAVTAVIDAVEAVEDAVADELPADDETVELVSVVPDADESPKRRSWWERPLFGGRS
jgi:hypothetical protein